jgi:hypothetical protein
MVAKAEKLGSGEARRPWRQVKGQRLKEKGSKRPEGLEAGMPGDFGGQKVRNGEVEKRGN